MPSNTDEPDKLKIQLNHFHMPSILQLNQIN